jgi:hypothetical protein
MTWDWRLYFPSEGSGAPDYYHPLKIHRPRSGTNPRTLGPVARTLTTSPPRSVYITIIYSVTWFILCFLSLCLWCRAILQPPPPKKTTTIIIIIIRIIISTKKLSIKVEHSALLIHSYSWSRVSHGLPYYLSAYTRIVHQNTLCFLQCPSQFIFHSVTVPLNHNT